MHEQIDIVELRGRFGWNQDDLARYLGVDQSTVSRLENGQKPSGPIRRLLDQLNERRGAA